MHCILRLVKSYDNPLMSYLCVMLTKKQPFEMDEYFLLLRHYIISLLMRRIMANTSSYQRIKHLTWKVYRYRQTSNPFLSALSFCTLKSAVCGWNYRNGETKALLWEALSAQAARELWELQEDLSFWNGQEDLLHLPDAETRPLGRLLGGGLCSFCVKRTVRSKSSLS